MRTDKEQNYLQNSKNWIEHIRNFDNSDFDNSDFDNSDFDNYRYYIKFAMLWMSLNSYYSSRYKHINGERNQIIEFAKDNKEIYNSLLENEFYNIVEKFRDTKYLDGISPREKVMDMREGSTGAEVFNSTKNSLQDFLFVIYQIRCNFFHGDKGETIGNTHDKNLVIWAYNYLDIFWKKFLEDSLS